MVKKQTLTMDNNSEFAVERQLLFGYLTSDARTPASSASPSKVFLKEVKNSGLRYRISAVYSKVKNKGAKNAFHD